MRKVVAPPGFRGYKPYGNRHGKKEHVDLLYEEYEAIKLADYDIMHHQQASELMGISRPTVTRIYASARKKIAEALTEGKAISIEGGPVEAAIPPQAQQDIPRGCRGRRRCRGGRGQ